ncbi:hypothetical protein NFI96_007952 [Prochilodus magdalenae]|nr:hypothetical protein NFI96_007952 [Prochilodus magdalenae]
MDPNRPPGPPGATGMPWLHAARGRGFPADPPPVGRARGLAVAAEELDAGRGRASAAAGASESPPLPYGRGILLPGSEAQVSLIWGTPD